MKFLPVKGISGTDTRSGDVFHPRLPVPSVSVWTRPTRDCHESLTGSDTRPVPKEEVCLPRGRFTGNGK